VESDFVYWLLLPMFWFFISTDNVLWILIFKRKRKKCLAIVINDIVSSFHLHQNKLKSLWLTWLLAGNVFTATTHIVTVVVGAGVLALAWAMAQLGWLAGIAAMIIFACISVYTYSLVADCYRFPDPVSGKRNYTYMQAVDVYLGIIIYFLSNSCTYIKSSCT